MSADDPSTVIPVLPRQPACGSGQHKGSYNTPLHVGALIIILVLSTLGALDFTLLYASSPMLTHSVPNQA